MYSSRVRPAAATGGTGAPRTWPSEKPVPDYYTVPTDPPIYYRLAAATPSTARPRHAIAILYYDL